MKTRDIVIGLIVLVILISAALLIKNSLNKKSLTVSSPTPTIEERIKDTFNGFTIPGDAEKTDLVDVSGGNSFGIATKTEILANLPDLESGKYYQAWLQNSEGKQVLLGNLRVAKGGYLIEYNSSSYSGYDKVIVTQGNARILEGSF